VQGHPQYSLDDMTKERSIPACAGPPTWGQRGRADSTVYPRVCRATQSTPVPFSSQEGLSPRVQGHRVEGRARIRVVRSIPACAGPPVGAFETSFRLRVYPRVCRATRPLVERDPGQQGLSPRVQGHRAAIPDTPPDQGSIPACAGPPPGGTCLSLHPRVYPRVCRATGTICDASKVAVGLSPRVQGHPPDCSNTVLRVRSIPACAGPPRRLRRPRHGRAVYPRVCRATSKSPLSKSRNRGLSPRVQGHLSLVGRDGELFGSIPACAGPPRLAP